MNDTPLPPRRAAPTQQTRTRDRIILTAGLAVTFAISACADESASTDWTFAPAADGESGSEAAQADPTTPPDEESSQDETERAEPLRPPAGNVIPRFVESERADQPGAADAIPAPPQFGPDVTQAPSPEPAPTRPSASAAPPGGEPAATATTEASPSAQASEPAVADITLVAEDSAFDTSELTVSAGATVRLTFENRDPIPHDFAVYLTDAADEAVFEGESLSGPGATQTYEFTAPAEPGEYFFRCDIHPRLMTGTLIVE